MSYNIVVGLHHKNLVRSPYLSHMRHVPLHVCSGSSFTKVSNFCRLANVKFLSEETYYAYQQGLLIPAAHAMTTESLNRSIAEANARGSNLAISTACSSICRRPDDPLQISHHNQFRYNNLYYRGVDHIGRGCSLRLHGAQRENVHVHRDRRGAYNMHEHHQCGLFQ